MTTTEEQFEKEAESMGMEAARRAASWVTDGNDSDESRRAKLKAIEDGDPAMDHLLPNWPNLSGEYADDPTTETILLDVVGTGYADALSNEERAALTDRLAEAWERGVGEVFTMACEQELRRWLDDSSES